MAWTMKLPNGAVVNSDDFTLADLGEVETGSGEPWSISNPMRNIKAAQVFLRIAYRMEGLDEAEIDTLKLGRLKNMFGFEEDKPFPAGDDADPLEIPSLSSTASSGGAAPSSTGNRASRKKSA